MVAYSFQRMFVPPILRGLGLACAVGHPSHQFLPEQINCTPKRQTIRAPRGATAKSRITGRQLYGHAQPGDELQLYTGMRTKQCMLIGRARCTDVKPIALHFDDPSIWIGQEPRLDVDEFARSDGFADGWKDLRAFWARHHPGVTDFTGVIIYWEP